MNNTTANGSYTDEFNSVYDYVTGTGYNGTADDFYNQLQNNEETFSKVYTEMARTGYKGSGMDFADLMGFGISDKIKAQEKQETDWDLNVNYQDILNKAENDGTIADMMKPYENSKKYSNKELEAIKSQISKNILYGNDKSNPNINPNTGKFYTQEEAGIENKNRNSANELMKKINTADYSEVEEKLSFKDRVWKAQEIAQHKSKNIWAGDQVGTIGELEKVYGENSKLHKETGKHFKFYKGATLDKYIWVCGPEQKGAPDIGFGTDGQTKDGYCKRFKTGMKKDNSEEGKGAIWQDKNFRWWARSQQNTETMLQHKVQNINKNSLDVKEGSAKKYFNEDKGVKYEGVWYNNYNNFKNRKTRWTTEQWVDFRNKKKTVSSDGLKRDSEFSYYKTYNKELDNQLDKRLYLEASGRNHDAFVKWKSGMGFDMNLASKEVVDNVIREEKTTALQNFARDIDDDDLRNKLYEEVQDDLYTIFNTDNDTDKKYKDQYKKAIKKDKELKKEGSDYVDEKNEVGYKGDAGKHVAKVLNEYLTQKNNELSVESESIDKAFKQLGDIDENSSRASINKYNDVVLRAHELHDEIDRFNNNISRLGDATLAIKALSLNYNFFDNLWLSIKTVGQEAIVMGSWIGKMGDLEFLQSETDHVQQLNILESLQNKRATQHPMAMKWKDMNLSNIGEATASIVANNAPSLVTSLTYGGIVKAGAKKYISKKIVNKAKYAVMGTFFTMESSARISEFELIEKNAKENIPKIEKELDVMVEAGVDENSEQYLEKLKELNQYKKTLETTEFEKGFVSLLYGTTATLAERLGSMKIMENLYGVSKVVGRAKFSNAAKTAFRGATMAGVEYGEEAITQIGHNLIDMAVMKENKSLFDGIDADFNVNVLFSTFAMQGPSTIGNIKNTVFSELSTFNERKENSRKLEELIDLKEQLNTLKDVKGMKAFQQRQDIRGKMVKITQSAAFANAYSFADMANMSNDEAREIFDNHKEMRDIRQEAVEQGASEGDGKSKSVRAKLKKLQERYSQLQDKNEEIRKQPGERRKIELEEYVGKENATVKNDFYYGKALQAFNLASAIDGITVGKYDNFQGAKVRLDELLKDKKVTQEWYDEAVKGLQDRPNNDGTTTFGANGIRIPGTNESILIKSNIARNIAISKNDIDKSFHAYAPLHEVIHIYDEVKGVFTGTEVNKNHKKALESIEKHLQHLKNIGKIDKKDYTSIRKRLDQYRRGAKQKGGVKLFELTTILAELQNSGVLDKTNVPIMTYLKMTLNNAMKSMLGKDKFWLFKMKDANDVIAYVRSFQRQTRKQMMTLPPEKEQQKKEGDVELSEGQIELSEGQLVTAINDLIPSDIKTREDYVKFTQDRRLFPPVFNATLDNGAISNYVKLKTTNSDEYNEAIDSVRMRLTNFNPEAKRKTDSKEKITFAEFIFANTNFAKLDAKKALAIEAAKTKKEATIDTKEAKEIADDTTTELDETLDKSVKPKINVLRINKIASKEQDIVDDVKVKEGDTFKEVISENESNVANKIFNIPGEKVSDPKKNLTYSNKIVNPETGREVPKGGTGVPSPSEAKSIQDVFADPKTTEDFIRTLPKTNVTEKDADINKLGENREVSKETLGRGIGLPNRILEYFYDKKFKADGKRARSQGKTSQVALWQLKDKFINPSAKTITKFQRDLGITEKQQLNELPAGDKRSTIGQLLKGAAKTLSQQVSLSAAQRKLEAKTKKAKEVKSEAEVKKLKQQTADITAAQNKMAFSEGANVQLVDLVNDIAGSNVDYYSMNEGSTQQKKEAVDKYINDVVDKIAPIFEKHPGLVGRSMFVSKNVIKDKSLRDYARKEIKDKAPLLSKSNPKLYGRKKFDNKTLKTFSDQQLLDLGNKNVKNFTLMWKLINKALQKDKNLVTPLLHFLDVSQIEGTHLMRLGAPLKAVDKGVKSWKFEHALQNTAAYRLLLQSAATQNEDIFNKTLETLKKNYQLVALAAADEKKLNAAGLRNIMSLDGSWQFDKNNWWERYFNELVMSFGGIDPANLRIIGSKETLADELNININGKVKGSKDSSQISFSEGVVVNRGDVKQKGITVLDFDDTLATTNSLVKYTSPDGTTGTLNAEEYANQYQDLLEQNYKFDFSEFNKVVKGKIAPLFQKALKLQKKFGNKDMFVLTARPAESAQAIHDFLKANGLNIPLNNITGLANSTSEAKALWMADKASKGYNDFYFADDALKNVQAVKNMLDQLDVKSKVQQAKVQFSEGLNIEFNKILEDVTGVEFNKIFSEQKARKRGASKGKFRLFVPPSHEDFIGLLYNFMGKGLAGDRHRNFFEKALVKPLNRGYRELDAAKQAIANDYKNLNKKLPKVKKKLKKTTPDGDFTYEDAIRVYLWNKHGHDIPGLSKTDMDKLVGYVMQDNDLRFYAENLNVISKQSKYVAPNDSWDSGDIRLDLVDATGRVGREKYFKEFLENANAIFSQENLNKIEAAYGKNFRSALEDMLHRIETGVNRPKGQSGAINKFMNWINGSVGAVMFFNMRSAVLQQMSIVNYFNFADNNILAAAKAFANQKQYWADWAYIFNSDMLKQRRGGIGTDINGAEMAETVKQSKNPLGAMIGKLLQLGFTPTQIGDNIAIATGGATYYRNRINKYLKDGLDQKRAQEKAWTDFQNVTQSTQQSARPDMTSQQQASWIGKLILNFQNITSQYNRVIKKAASDIYNKRISPPYATRLQSNMGNLSKILYYGAIQNLIFYSLQTALFAVMFGDNDDEEEMLKKKERVINGSIDSILRGSGIYGAIISTAKNMYIKYEEQRDKGWNKDESAVLMEMLNFSPVVGIKSRKIVSAEKTLNYNESVIKEMKTFDIDNPTWSAVTNYIEATTNLPVNRLYKKTINVRDALNKEHSAFQRALMFIGYSKWNLGIEDEKIKEIKETVKEKKKEIKKEKDKVKKIEKEKQKKEENKKKIEDNLKKKDGVCAGISRGGERCKRKAVSGGMCTIHEKAELRKDGKKTQCKKVKKGGKRCKMQTSSKSGYCYYHD